MLNKQFRAHGNGRATQAVALTDLHQEKLKKPRGKGKALEGRVCAACSRGRHGECYSRTCGCGYCLVTGR